MVNVDRDWEKVYENKSTPWDVELPERELIGFVERGAIKPCRVLELGCGNGNDSIFLAKRGFDVTGVDISKLAIQTAKSRALESGVNCNFLAQDVTDLKSVKGRFGFIYDRACFHFIPIDKREKYINNVNGLLEKGGIFVLIVSSDKDTVKGPYQFSQADITKLFEKDFDILEIKLITLNEHKEKPTPYFCLMRKR